MAFADLKAKALEKTKAAPANKNRDRGGNYNGRTPAGVLGATGAYQPYGRMKPSDGYNYARAVAVAKGVILERSAPEEVETHLKLRKLMGMHFGFRPTFGDKGFLAVGSSRFLPTRDYEGNEIDELVAYRSELQEKVAVWTTKAIDFDHPAVRNFMRAKGMSEKDMTTKAMSVLTDSAGGTLVPAPAQGEFIELQRNFEAFTRAGAREVPLPPQGRVSYPKQVGGSTAYWVGEAVSITASDLSTSSLYLEAKKLGVLTTISDELMRFSDPQVNAILQYDQAMQSALKADVAMFTGTGGTQITGILNYPTGTANAAWTQGTDKVLLRTASVTDTNGDTLQPQDPALLSGLLPDPVQSMPKSFIFYTPLATAVINKRADAVSANDQKGPFVFNLNRDPATGLPNGLDGNKLVTSYNVPSNRIKGSGTNLTILLVGAFSDWLIGRSGVVEFDSNPWSNFAQVQTQLRTIQYIDAGPRHNASFGYIDSLLPST